MSELDLDDLKVIRNERLKLVANTLDRACTACIAVGLFTFLSQTFAQIFGDEQFKLFDQASRLSWNSLVIPLIWIFFAVALHLAGQYVLGGLRK